MFCVMNLSVFLKFKLSAFSFVLLNWICVENGSKYKIEGENTMWPDKEYNRYLTRKGIRRRSKAVIKSAGIVIESI